MLDLVSGKSTRRELPYGEQFGAVFVSRYKSESAMDTSEDIEKPNTTSEPEPFVDAGEAGKFLRLRPRRVLEMARQAVIPAYPLGEGKRRVWRFRLSELASAICSRGVHCAHAAVRAKEKN